ncbi:ATP-binding cassette domain-containing protein [Mesorhizobium sp. NPDC059054]|uniref:ATP-binding cassette domain-containing protein n=1 Tax=Mesorhizobium sp. NPDC059054 TaxID=3346711 RepID=UPI00367603FE
MASGMLTLARSLAAGGLRGMLLLQILRTALRLVFAGALAIFAGVMIEAGVVSIPVVVVGLATLLLTALVGLFADRQQAVAEFSVAQGLRESVREKLAAMPARAVQTLPAGALIAGLQRYPEALSALVVGHRAAALMLGIVPALVVCAIVAVSWQAALALLFATPVMIAFFILVGGTIHARAQHQERAFGQLATQFDDRIRTLPTILSAHGVDHERRKLAVRMAAYADSTMNMLKVAFLNAGVIDFFSSLSIAILAVFLGLGHLKLVDIPGFSGMQLWQSLFILMLAPEFFAPFRRYAEQYHAKAEGNAAALAMDGFLAGPATLDQTMPLAFDRFEGDLRLPPKGIVAIVGESGAGKSTLLRRLAGIETPAGARRTQPDPAFVKGVDWISTDTPVQAGTLADVLSWNRGEHTPTQLLSAANRVGLLDDTLLPGGLDARIRAGGENLSGGQRLRIGVARALISDRPIFADEPTAKLDVANAARVRNTLADCARERLVVVATHDPEMKALAVLVIDLDRQRLSQREIAV